MNITVGDKFGKLTVISKQDAPHNSYRYACRCDCGNEREFPHNALARGNNKSCGCLSKSHGMTGTRIYETWKNMKRRCDEPSNKSYAIYGGRGITYDDRWSLFEPFYEDMKDGYADDLTLDRIDPDLNYTKENCRWSDKEEQANNTRTNHLVTYKGETLTMSQMARKHGIKVDLLKGRLYKGWTVKDAIETVTEPETLTYLGKTKTVTEWAEKNGMTYHQLKKRLMRGWDVERAITQPLRKRPTIK